MSEYALYKGRPVRILNPLQARENGGRMQKGDYLGTEVELFDGNRPYAHTSNLEPIKRPEYDRLVKEEVAEKERLSKKEGLGSCEFLALKKHGTQAAQTRGR